MTPADLIALVLAVGAGGVLTGISIVLLVAERGRRDRHRKESERRGLDPDYERELLKRLYY